MKLRWPDGLKGKNKDQEDEENRRDSLYEEVRRRSTFINDENKRNSMYSRHSSQKVETTVKLRKIMTGGRRIYINLPLPSFEFSKKGAPPVYATNKIRTSKYTIITFVPKNLFEQFRRPANLYFLGMAILQMLPTFGVKSPALTLLPICAVVFISAAKDAFEDFQRHKVDEQYNQNITHTLSGYQNTNYIYSENSATSSWLSLIHRNDGTKLPKKEEPVTNQIQENTHDGDVFVKSLSRDIRVGDFVLLRNGDSLPADAVLLSTSDKEGVCFVETKDLDGETNLKPKNSVQQLKHIQSGADCLNECQFYIEAGPPTPDLYKFQGTIVTLEKSSHNKFVETGKIPIGIENLLLRGQVIRNTKWAIAVVLFTGTDTKIMLNSGETPSKRSRVDKEMNKEIFIAFAVLFLLCLVCAIMSGVFRYRTMINASAQLFTGQTSSPGYTGFINFWSSLIIFQNIIPISLYVSIEFVKTFQAYFIWNDLDMWDDEAKKPCVPKTWTLSDDLGQVEYIFSDKTGTLTRNVMEFRECSIGGVRYGDNGFSPESEGARGARLRREKEERAQHGDEENQSNSLLPTAKHLENPVLISTEKDPLENTDQGSEDEGFQERRKEIFHDYETQIKKVFDPSYSSLDPNRLSFADPQLYKDIIEKDDQSTRIKEFFMLLALCHTVVIEKIGKDGKVMEDEDEEDEVDDDRNKSQPKIGKGDIVQKDDASLNSASSSDTSAQKKGISNLLQTKKIPGIRHLKRNNLQRSKSRGEEFNLITEEDDTEDRVDKTVKTQIMYKGESPDEAALVDAAKNAGFAFIKRKGKFMTVDILGEEHTFELLHVLEFNSDRKRMSVIIRRPSPWNDIILYCKGADNVIEERLTKEEQHSNIFDTTNSHINLFSESGLRTLLTSYRILDEKEYEPWRREIEEASTATENRSEKLAAIQEKIEVKLKLLGATGIEDKLQEGVPQCIEDFRKAQIKIWVLTGDKLQTAINIGFASNLLDGDMKLWTIKGSESPEEVLQRLVDTSNALDDIENNHSDNIQENALVIEGSALLHIFESSEAKENFLDIAIRCKSVICCRVSPLQKALVVELVRKYHNVVTLAVGDGANDVSMIQVANVGVGIAGKEGVQASMAADYAISQFRFLHKLLLVQGHWSYARISEMILTFFFKNIFWVITSLWYQIFSAWSGNIFYDYSFLQLYNIIFTIAPVIILGSTDQDLTSPYLKNLPSVHTIRGKLYTKFKFWLYFADGVWQSLVIFFSFYFLYMGGNPNSNGHPESGLQLSTSVAITAIVLANIMPGFNTFYWTWWQFTAIGIELIVAFLFVVVYGAFNNTLHNMAQMVYGQGSFWLTFLLAVVLAFMPRFTITFICQWWYPTVVSRGRHLELFERKLKKKKAKDSTTHSEKKKRLNCF